MSLTRHSIQNIVGSAIPLLVAIPSMAILARNLGVERFGLVTLAWALVGYAGVFDLGLSRAAVRMIAATADKGAHAVTVSSATLVVFSLSLVAAVATWALASPLCSRLLGVSPELMGDAVSGFRLVALTIPVLLPTLVAQSYWDGVQDFVEANVQRALGGSLAPILTAAASIVEPTFVSAMCGVLLARVVGLAIVLMRKNLHTLVRPVFVRAHATAELVRFGRWVALTNIVSPVMGYLDRFILSSAQGAGVVAYYAAPAEVAFKLLALPTAVTRSLFPMLIDPAAPQANALAASRVLVAASCVPLAVFVAIGADGLLAAWLGGDFAERAAPALRILMLGFLFSAFAQIPFTQLHAKGRSDVTAWIQVIEVLPFLWGAFELCKSLGVIGAALAWSMRNAVDLVLLTVAARTVKSLP